MPIKHKNLLSIDDDWNQFQFKGTNYLRTDYILFTYYVKFLFLYKTCTLCPLSFSLSRLLYSSFRPFNNCIFSFIAYFVRRIERSKTREKKKTFIIISVLAYIMEMVFISLYFLSSPNITVRWV